MSRRIYNANVRAYDSLVQTFPSLIIARQFNFAVAAVLRGRAARCATPARRVDRRALGRYWR